MSEYHPCIHIDDAGKKPIENALNSLPMSLRQQPPVVRLHSLRHRMLSRKELQHLTLTRDLLLANRGNSIPLNRAFLHIHAMVEGRRHFQIEGRYKEEEMGRRSPTQLELEVQEGIDEKDEDEEYYEERSDDDESDLSDEQRQIHRDAVVQSRQLIGEFGKSDSVIASMWRD